MGNSTAKIKPAYSLNLEELIKEEKITKKKLAEEISTSVQTISKACNGVRLTKGMAESIIDKYPKYNLGWLLGYSNLKYKDDAGKLYMEQAEKSRLARLHEETIFDTIARLAGDIGYNTFFDGSVMTIEPTSEQVENYGWKPVVLTFKNGKLPDLQDDVALFMKYLLETIVRRGQEAKEAKQ